MGQQEIRNLIRPVVLLLDARGQGEEPLDLAVPVASSAEPGTTGRT